MSAQSLEARYIHYLDDTHFKGYAEQLFFDDEKAYYKGMFRYLSMGLSQESLVEDKYAFERIIKNQQKYPWISAYKVTLV